MNETGKGKGSGTSVLIVDDKAENLRLLAKILKVHDYNVRTLRRGEMVMPSVRSSPPDIILLDIMMPGIDGFETCRILQASPESKDIPVIFMTALTDTVDEVRGLGLGAVDYITKPIRVETVLARVNLHLSLRKLQKELEEKNRQLKAEIAENEHLQSQLRQVHKMKAIGTMTGGIAHEFNNILGIILGNTDIAMDDVPEWNPARFNLEEIRTACFRAKNVIRQLMYLCQKTELMPKPINIIPIVKGSLELMQAAIPSSVSIRLNLPETADRIYGNPSQLHQVMVNLYNNAVQAMEEKGGVLEVSVENCYIGEDSRIADKCSGCIEPDAGEHVCLTVSDSGQGIAPDILERIFEPYFTTRRIGEGSGLGLAIVYGIIRNHGAGIRISSEPGKGSCFRLYFPVVHKKEDDSGENTKF